MAIRTCVFQRNKADLRGGAISNWGTYFVPMQIENCVFEQNEAVLVRLRCPSCVAANTHHRLQQCH